MPRERYLYRDLLKRYHKSTIINQNIDIPAHPRYPSPRPGRSGAAETCEPRQVREEAAVSGKFRAPPGCLPGYVLFVQLQHGRDPVIQQVLVNHLDIRGPIQVNGICYDL